MTESNETQSKPKSKTWLIVLVAVLGGIVLPVSLYGWLAYSFWSNKPQLKRNYAAELNAPTEQIPAMQRAWPKLRPALVKLKPGLDRWKPEEFTPESGSWQEILTFVAKKQAALAELREAAKLPHLGYIYTDTINRDDVALYADGPVSPEEMPEPASENPPILELDLNPQQQFRC